MPYIKQEFRNRLNHELRSLARKIIVLAKNQIGESPIKRLVPYRYICWELGLKAVPVERYTLLSGIRASFGDACDDWCWRKEIKLQKVELPQMYFPELNDRINRLAHKIQKIVKEKNDDLLFQGILTYCWVRLGLLITHTNDELMNRCVAGTLYNLYRDKKFYPTVMIPHEKKQIAKHGDVYSEKRVK